MALESVHTGSVLARLQVDASPICYRTGPPPRMAALPPDQALRQIDRVVISRFVERQGVTYYILEVFLKNACTKPVRAIPTLIVGMPEVPEEAERNCSPSFEVARRYSDFEALRRRLSVCFQNLHPGCCTYCDAFVGFLSCSTIQPGLFTKLTKRRATQRRAILCRFINKTMELALQRHREPELDSSTGPCDGRLIIPQVVGCFLREGWRP